MGAQEPDGPFSRAGLGTVVRPTPNPNTLAAGDHLELRPMEVADGLSHHGEPAEEEVIVVEEPERPERGEPRVVRAPRVPTQKERETPMRRHTYHMRSGVKPAWQVGAGTSPTNSAGRGG